MASTEHALSVREKLGYSLGDLAANLIFQTLITYLAFFYTDVYRPLLLLRRQRSSSWSACLAHSCSPR